MSTWRASSPPTAAAPRCTSSASDPRTNRLDQSGPDNNVFGEYDDRGNMTSSLGGYEIFTGMPSA